MITTYGKTWGECNGSVVFSDNYRWISVKDNTELIHFLNKSILEGPVPSDNIGYISVLIRDYPNIDLFEGLFDRRGYPTRYDNIDARLYELFCIEKTGAATVDELIQSNKIGHSVIRIMDGKMSG